jgi:hypothetical protein
VNRGRLRRSAYGLESFRRWPVRQTTDLILGTGGTALHPVGVSELRLISLVSAMNCSLLLCHRRIARVREIRFQRL